MAFDLDREVQAQMGGLIAKLRAKRLQGELPPPVDAVPQGDAPPAEDPSDFAALESMLDVE